LTLLYHQFRNVRFYAALLHDRHKGDDTDIKKALKTKAKVTLKPFKKKEGLDVNPQEMIESINASVINGSRLLWLKESEKAMAV